MKINLNKPIQVHPFVALVFSILFVITLVWTFTTSASNQRLEDTNSSNRMLLKMQDSILTRTGREHDAELEQLKALVGNLQAEKIILERKLAASVLIEKEIITKYKTVYEKIKMDTSLAHQLVYTNELLARFDELYSEYSPTN